VISSVQLLDFASNVIAGKSVVYTSINSPGVTTSGSLIGVGDARTYTTDTSGSITASLLPTNYSVELAKPDPATQWYIDSTGAVISSSLITGSTSTVIFNLDYIDIVPLNTKKLTITPQDNYPRTFSGSLIMLAASSSKVDANGSLTINRMIPGVYLCEAYGGKITTPFYINVPSAGGTYFASNLVVVKPAKAVKVKVSQTDNSFVYTVSSSQALFVAKGGAIDSASYAGYALTASYALNAGGNGGGLATGSTYPITASQALTASYAQTANTSNTTTLLGGLWKGVTTGDESTIIDVFDNPASRFTYNSAADTFYFGQGTQVIVNPVNTASYARTASYAMNGGTGGGLATGSTYPITASQSVTASYWNSSSLVTIVNNKQNAIATGSTLPITSSQSLTASYALNGGGIGGGLATGSTYPITASQSVTASYWNSSSLNTWAANNFQFKIATGSTLPITASRAISASYAPNSAIVNGGSYNISASWASGSAFAPVVFSNVQIVNGQLLILSDIGTWHALSIIDDGAGNATTQLTSTTNTGSYYASGSVYYITSSTEVTYSSFATSALWADNAGNAISSSYALTASYALNGGSGGGGGLATGSTYPFTSSQSVTASYWNSSSLNAWATNKFQFKIATGSTIPITSSQALTASYVSQSVLGDGVYNIEYISSASYALLSPPNPTTLYVISSSGIIPNDDNTFNGTASYASVALTASYAMNGGGVGGGLATGSTYPFTSSQSVTASYALNAGSAFGLATGSTYPITSSQSVTASYWNSSSINSWAANNFQSKIATGSLLPITSSQSLTASYALNAGAGGGLATGSTYPITASQALTASYALNAGTGGGLATGSTYPITASQALNAISASGGLAVGGYHQGLINTSSVQLGFGIPKNQHSNINVQIGYGVNANSISSSGEVAIGYEAGKDTANGNQAVKIGFWAGKTSTTSDLAVQIGNEAAGNSTTASQAVQIGHDAAKNSTDASIAIQIGSGAGYDAKSALGAVMIGYHAGYNAATGSYSTLIGTNADTYNSSLSITRSIAIGYNAKVSASRTAAIGGTGADSIKVTIGGTSAVNTLDVVGNISCSVITASLFGSASYALASSTASYVSQSVLGDGIERILYISSASYALLSPPNPTTLYVITSSGVIPADVTTFEGTSSYALVALTASYALNGGGVGGGGLETGSTYPFTSSQSVSSSYAWNAQNAYILSSLFIGKLNGDEYTITDLYESPEIRFIYNSASDIYSFGQGTQVIVNPVNTASYARTASYAPSSSYAANGVFASSNYNYYQNVITANKSNNLTVSRIAVGLYGCTFSNPAPDSFYNVMFSGISQSRVAPTVLTASCGGAYNKTVNNFTMSIQNTGTGVVRNDPASASVVIYL